MKEFPYIFLELETSGLNAPQSEMISLSALRLCGGAVDRFSTLIRPTIPLSQTAETVTGLTNVRLSQAPEVAEAIREFEIWRREEAIVLCRPEFELPFVVGAYEKASVDFHSDLVHSLEEDRVRSALWKFLFPRNTESNSEK